MNQLKISIAFLACLLSAASFSQMRFGVSLGMNLSNISAVDDGENLAEDNKLLLGYNFKGLAEYVINDNFSVETGLGFSRKGYAYKSTEVVAILGESTTITSEGHEKYNYIDLPVVFKGGIPINESRIYAGIGPNLGFATGGKYLYRNSVSSNSGSQTDETSGDIDFNNSNFNRFDYGLKGLLGYEKNGISVEAAYEYGLANLNGNDQSSTLVKNQVISLSFGFKLGGF